MSMFRSTLIRLMEAILICIFVVLEEDLDFVIHLVPNVITADASYFT